MKKILYPLALVALFFSTNINVVNAQVVDLFCEDFEDPDPNNWGFTNTVSIPTRPVFFYSERTVTATNSSGAAADTVGDRTKAYLTTPSFRVDQYISYLVKFDHICYMEGLDDAKIQYTFNGGQTWADLPAFTHKGNSVQYDFPFSNEQKFSKISNPGLWKLGDTTFIWGANSNGWVTETFNLSDLVLARPSNSDSMALRLAAIDDSSSVRGRVGEHIWYIDNFCVRGGNCELEDPILNVKDKPDNYPVQYQGRVYWEGPWIFNATATDVGSGVDTVYIAYQVKRETPAGSGMYTEFYRDTIGMDRLGAPNFKGQIDKVLPNSAGQILVGDSVLWKVVVEDKSDCVNSKQFPPRGFNRFIVKPRIPPSCTTSPIYEFPYVEDFEGQHYVNGQKTVIGNPNADFDNITGDFHNWWVNRGPSSQTGPLRINDSYPPGGKYIYVESLRDAGGNYKDSLASVVTPCFDFSELPNGLVRFYLNMNTSSLSDSVVLDIYDPTPLQNFPFGKFVKSVVPTIQGNRGAAWFPVEFSTFPYKTFITQLRITAYPGEDNGFSDIGLDSFKIIPAALVDVRANSVNITPYTPQGNGLRDSVRFNFQNLGVADVNQFTMGFEIVKTTVQADGSIVETVVDSTLVDETYNGVVEAGKSTNITFRDPGNDYLVPFGDYYVKVWVNLPGDNIPSNDTVRANSSGLLITNPKTVYMDDFDSAPMLWTSLGDSASRQNIWELGTPNYDYTYSAYTEPNSWDIMLNQGYTGTGQSTRLVSPFFDFSQVDDAIISFINNRDITKAKDGVFLEYSLDRGISWDSIKSDHDPGKIKWYNASLSSGGLGGTPVLAGKTYCLGNTWAGFLESEVVLPPLFNFKPEVLLRFTFFAEDDDDGNDGMSIDNILVYDPEPLDLQVQHYLSPTSRCDLSPNQKITTIIKNRGLNTVNSFQMEYTVTHVPTNTTVVKVDNINRTIEHRDTIHVTSQSTFDMFTYGDYNVKVKAVLPNDAYALNDSLVKLVENVEGCSLQFFIETSKRQNVQLPCDTSVWKFNYTSGGRSYQISDSYNSADFPINIGTNRDTIKDLFVCIKNNSKVRFELDDFDTLISKYSFIAYDGERDVVLYEEVNGGPDSPVQEFNWFCPPERSATPILFHINNDKLELPIPGQHSISVDIYNNGLDSLDDVELYFQIDDRPTIFNKILYDPDLDYRDEQNFFIGDFYIGEGPHTLTAWTKSPNGQQDLSPLDDTLVLNYFVLQTSALGGGNNGSGGSSGSVSSVCYAFDGDNSTDDSLKWISLNPYTLSQENNLFENGAPNKTNINSVTSGTSAWVTKLDTSYGNFAQGMLVSPFFNVSQDSCYRISFKHNFYITDSINDGGTIRYLDSSWTGDISEIYRDNFWIPLGGIRVTDTIDYRTGETFSRDTIILGDTIFAQQNNWYNRRHIIAIPDNNRNYGWSGNSNGWITSSAIFRPAFTDSTLIAFRFESDASRSSEGWAIDDVCIDKIAIPNCYPVSVPELGFNENDIYLGQNIPNPATFSTVIPYYLPKSGEATFEIINLLGQPVYVKSGYMPRGDGLLELDVNAFAKGVYYYSMTFDGKKVTNKMVISQ